MKKIEFGKNNSLALKGVAIIMMLFHHCFLPDRFIGYSVNFWPLSENRVVIIAEFFKMCVSLFAFITGYGLMQSYKKLKSKEDMKISKWIIHRLVKMLSGYWIIVLLSLIICQLLNGLTYETFFNSNSVITGIFEMLFTFTGLEYLFKTPMLIGTWWYMSIAVLFVFSIPLLYALIKKYGYFITATILMIIPRVFAVNFVTNSFFPFLFVVYLGMLCADKNLVIRVSNFKLYKKNKYINLILSFILETIVVYILFKAYMRMPNDRYWEINFGIIPMCIIFYLYNFYLRLPVIKSILQFLGKHSMNIFLTHTFIRAVYLKDFVMKGNNFIVIVLILLALSIVLSLVLEFFKKMIHYQSFINYLDKRIDTLLKKRKKAHR